MENACGMKDDERSRSYLGMLKSVETKLGTPAMRSFRVTVRSAIWVIYNRMPNIFIQCQYI